MPKEGLFLKIKVINVYIYSEILVKYFHSCELFNLIFTSMPFPFFCFPTTHIPFLIAPLGLSCMYVYMCLYVCVCVQRLHKLNKSGTICLPQSSFFFLLSMMATISANFYANNIISFL